MAKYGPTEFFYLQGKTKWFRHTTPDPWGFYKHILYLNPESLEIFNNLKKRDANDVEGIKNKISKDEDGYFVTLKRPAQKTINGKVIGFMPPDVLDHEGKPLRDILVGNGSDITTKLEVYRYGIPGGGVARACRWLSSRIDNLIPFEKNRDFDDLQNRAVKNLEAQPMQNPF